MLSSTIQILKYNLVFSSFLRISLLYDKFLNFIFSFIDLILYIDLLKYNRFNMIQKIISFYYFHPLSYNSTIIQTY